jgi:hypothetical protein
MEATTMTPDSDDTLLEKQINGPGSGENKDAHFPSRKVRLTVNLPQDLVEQMRDAVYWTPGLTLAWLIARAMRTSLTELRSTDQGPFPKRSKPLRAGRPRLTGQTMRVPRTPAITVVHRAVERIMGTGTAPETSME